MNYNPDAMTVIVSGDLAPEIMDNLKNQLTADVMTTSEFRDRENALAQQEQVEADTKENREAAGLEEGDENSDTGFNAPDEGEIEDTDVTDTSDDTEDTTEKEPEDDDEVETDPADEEEVSDEDKEVTDDLNEPNAALEHAKSIGTREVGHYLRLGVDKYRRRVRRQRKELTLARETLEMDAAQRQKLIRRLFYVKPSDTGFTSKMQTFISSIGNAEDWVALIDTDGMVSSDHELSRKQIEAALRKAGIDIYDNVETLADTINQVQAAITEPAKNQVNNDYGTDSF